MRFLQLGKSVSRKELLETISYNENNEMSIGK